METLRDCEAILLYKAIPSRGYLALTKWTSWISPRTAGCRECIYPFIEAVEMKLMLAFCNPQHVALDELLGTYRTLGMKVPCLFNFTNQIITLDTMFRCLRLASIGKHSFQFRHRARSVVVLTHELFHWHLPHDISDLCHSKFPSQSTVTRIIRNTVQREATHYSVGGNRHTAMGDESKRSDVENTV